MAAHILRLRLAALIAPMRGGWRGAVRAAWQLALVAIATGIVVAGVIALGTAPSDIVYVASIALGAAMLLGFLAVPFVGGSADPLPVRAFATLPLSPGALAAALGATGIISVPMAAVLVVDVALAVVWAAHGAPVIACVVSVLAHAVLCALAARIGFALNEALLRGRRSPELAVVFAVAALAVVAPATLMLLSMSWHGGAPEAAQALAGAVAFTPLGAATAIGAFGAVAGSGVVALLSVSGVVTVLTIAGAAAGWGALVARAFRTAPRERTRASARLGWFRIFPGTAAGAIGARGLMYWVADRRYLANVAIIPVAGLLPLVPLAVAGVPGHVLAMIPLPIIAAFLGWLAHNDLAYDSEAVWIHLVTGVRGLSDRVGRLIPLTFVAVPMLALTIAATAFALDRWSIVPELAAMAACLYLSGLGFSSIASVVTPYAVARPGDSAFRQPQRTGARGVLAPSIALFASIAVSFPTLIGGWRTMLGGAPESDPVVLGWTTGSVVLVAGVGIGALLFDRRGHRAMELALRA